MPLEAQCGLFFLTYLLLGESSAVFLNESQREYLQREKKNCQFNFSIFNESLEVKFNGVASLQGMQNFFFPKQYQFDKKILSFIYDLCVNLKDKISARYFDVLNKSPDAFMSFKSTSCQFSIAIPIEMYCFIKYLICF